MQGYTLGKEALRQIRQLVANEARRAVRTVRPTRDTGVAPQAIYLAKSPAGGIPAMSGSTPGSATCDVYRINDDGDVEVVTDSQDETVQITAYNLSTSAVAASTFIHTKQEIVSGANLVDFEDCG